CDSSLKIDGCKSSSPLIPKYRSIRVAASSQYSSFISKPIAGRCKYRAVIAVVPEPINGSRTTSPLLDEARMIRSITETGNCAGCGVLSFEALFFPDVTLGNCHTSVGFLPKGLTFTLPFFF